MQLPDDPILLELLPEFIDDWLQQLDEKYAVLANAQDAHEMYRLGHTLKGSCLQFGLDDIATMGIEIMGWTKTAEWDTIRAKETDLRTAFQAAKAFAQEHLGS